MRHVHKFQDADGIYPEFKIIPGDVPIMLTQAILESYGTPRSQVYYTLISCGMATILRD